DAKSSFLVDQAIASAQSEGIEASTKVITLDWRPLAASSSPAVGATLVVARFAHRVQWQRATTRVALHPAAMLYEFSRTINYGGPQTLSRYRFPVLGARFSRNPRSLRFASGSPWAIADLSDSMSKPLAWSSSALRGSTCMAAKFVIGALPAIRSAS